MPEYEFLGKYDDPPSKKPRRRRKNRDPNEQKGFFGRLLDFVLWSALFGLVILITVLGSLWYFLGQEL